jgi:lipopolysaccharide transport system permease protein
MNLNLSELWAYRDLISTFGRRDITLRYRQTALGVSWVVCQPLLGAAILAFVFGRVAKLDSGGIPYFPFVLVGMVAWGAFSGILSRASASLLQNSALISKVYFPRLVLPLSTVPSVLLDLAVGAGLVAGAMVVYHVPVTWRLLTLPLWLGGLASLALALGLLLALSVRYRDVQHVLPVLMQLGFYATPAAYSATAIPERFRGIYMLNPAAPTLEAVRWSVMQHGLMSEWYLVYAMLVSVGLLWASALVFRGMERSFADVI